jgi:ribosome recycling factor
MRTGRANAGLVDGIRVEYYGSLTPIKQLANIAAPEADLIVIKPFDHSALGSIEKAILKSDVGIHPSNDGKVIRLQVPPLSQERRKQLAHRAKETAEEARVAVRNVRRDANKQADGLSKTMGEDVLKQLKDEVQKLTDSFERKIDDCLEGKSTELTTM